MKVTYLPILNFPTNCASRITSPIRRLSFFNFLGSSFSLEICNGLLKAGQPSFFQAFQCSSRFKIFFTISVKTLPSGGVSTNKTYICSVVVFTHSIWSGFNSCVSLENN